MIRILLNINYQMHRCQISYIFRIFHNESSFLRPIDKIRFTKQLEQDKKGSNLHSQAGNVKIKIIVETFNIENASFERPGSSFSNDIFQTRGVFRERN